MGEFIVLAISIGFSLFVIKKILPPRGVKQITIDELRGQLKDESIQFIDVRPVDQYNEFHIYGFKSIPLHELRQRVGEISKDKKVIIMSRTGAQGNEASKRLKRRGYTDLSNVRGGMSTWTP